MWSGKITVVASVTARSGRSDSREGNLLRYYGHNPGKVGLGLTWSDEGGMGRTQKSLENKVKNV